MKNNENQKLTGTTFSYLTPDEMKKLEQDYYKNKLQEGNNYEKFIGKIMRRIGMPIIPIVTKVGQNYLGENLNGYEIKYDGRMKTTGNVYIETAEKKSWNKLWVDSGIYRQDNSWLYIIGNTEVIFFFTKVQLQLMCKEVVQYQHSDEELFTKKYSRVETPTSKGFLVPMQDAIQRAARVIFLKADLVNYDLQ